ICTFQGYNPFPSAGRSLLDSLFYIVDMSNIHAQQIINNIIAALQGTYLQRNIPSLGRVYTVVVV
ncbi:22104_t:CDS:1, partial [Racocetra persica]